MKTYIILLFIFMFGIKAIIAQTWTHDFEASGGYTLNASECTDGANDYFIRTDGSNINDGPSGSQGTFYFAAQDIDGECGVPGAFGTMLFNDININGCTGLSFEVLAATFNSAGWDNSDYVHILYDIDNSGSWSNLIWFENDGTTFNTSAELDTDFDGTGNGTNLTSTFQNFSASISGTGAVIDIRVEFLLNSGDEDIALDNFRIYGTGCGVAPTNTITVNSISSLTYSVDCSNGTSGTINITSTEVFSAGNVYSVELSDASGSFTSPTTIGSISSTSNGPMDISFTIPAGTATGSGYRIRIVSSAPIVVSANNGNNIAITNTAAPCITPSQCVKILQFQVDPEDGNNGTSSNTGEFIQICNICDADVDISCFTICLTDDDAGDRRGNCIRIPFNTTISAEDCYLIGGNGTVSSGSPDWSSASLDLNWHTCGCAIDINQAAGQYVGVLSDGGEDITLFDENGDVIDAVTYESGGGATYTETVNMPSNGSCGTLSIDIPPSSSHVNVGSTPAGEGDDEGWLFDCNTQSWGFANHNSSDGIQDLNPSMTYTCLPIPLPVEFTFFEGEKYSKYSNILFWQTISEHNSSFFRIEKTNDFNTWETVGDRNAAHESQEVINYQLIDDRIENIVNYYRLLQFDLDGKMTNYPKYVAIDNRLNSTDLSVEIFNLLGQKVDENYAGIQIHVFSDGTIKKVFK